MSKRRCILFRLFPSIPSFSFLFAVVRRLVSDGSDEFDCVVSFVVGFCSAKKA